MKLQAGFGRSVLAASAKYCCRQSEVTSQLTRAYMATATAEEPESYSHSPFRDCGGQSEKKRRASPDVGCGPQIAAMRFHD